MALPRLHVRDALDWRDLALCRDADPEIFFPVAESGPALARAEAEALEWCALCPVRAQCLEFALAALPEGIAGGMTARQRRELRRATYVPAPGDRRPGPLHAPTREVRARGIELLIKRVPRAEVAQRLRVARRTVDRWATLPECVEAGVERGTGGRPSPNILSVRETRPRARAVS